MSINSKDSKLKEKKDTESERKQYREVNDKNNEGVQKKRVLTVRVYKKEKRAFIFFNL